MLPSPRARSQDVDELYSNLVESVVNVRQLEGEFVDSISVDKSEGVQSGIAKSKMWWFENLSLSSTVVEVLRNGYKLPFLQLPNPCLIPNNISALHEDEFVRRAIEELLTKRCIVEVESPPYCCNP